MAEKAEVRADRIAVAGNSFGGMQSTLPIVERLILQVVPRAGRKHPNYNRR
jgi:ATP-dependent protease Clp ATPase subunit